ncbi:MAG: sugar ABC transporter permease [Lachnospiraceae bacterium]|nr:sugar ABC transporter permease [Lachnospiraceae bacterium]
MKLRRKYTGILLFLPIFIGMLVFFAIPFGMVVSYSFGLGGGQVRFVGLENYRKVLNSEAFQLAAGNTAKFLVIGVPLLLVLALCVALLLRRNLPGQKLCANSILLPLVLPIASIVMVVEWLVPAPVLESPAAFWVLLVLYLWKNCGYITVLLLAGLSMIPEGLYDTAAMEGANSWQKLWYITLPLLVPSLAFSAVIGIINSFKSYREAFLLGGRHPHESIYMLQHFLNNNFENLNYGRLAVASVMTALPIVLMTVAVLLLSGKNEEGDRRVAKRADKSNMPSRQRRRHA